jgi:endonuclease/exonuclease/phosphatase family metal-dependent hydrolase
MKILTWNVLSGQRLTTSSEDKSFYELGLGSFDVIALQEVDENQERSGFVHQTQEIARRHGFVEWAYARTIIGTPGISWRKTGSVENGLHDNIREKAYGISLLSKVPVLQWHRLELGRSLIGMPLLIGSEKGAKIAYVKDEPRVAIIAELANGFTVAATHLSFVPFVNLYQLFKIRRFISRLPGKKIIVGDLNLGWGLPARFIRWSSLISIKSYPSFKPAIQFDYIVSKEKLQVSEVEFDAKGFSDHLPLAVEIID